MVYLALLKKNLKKILCFNSYRSIIINVAKKFLDKGFTFEASDRYYFLDPYYQTSDHSETIQYMKYCMHDMNYAKHAFLRNVLYWLCVLIKKNIYPNYMTDIMFQKCGK